MSDAKSHGLARGGAVTIIGQAATTVLSLISIVVLSRLLPPSDFGLIAMVGVVTAFGSLLQDMGLGVSALRAPNLSNSQASNLFWLNAGLGLMTSGLVAASGPVLAHVYSEPRLIGITPFLAISVFLGGLQSQLQVHLARAQKFGSLALISAVSNLLGLVAATTGALLGLGYWSLVVQAVTVSSVGLLLKGLAAHWLPLRPRRGVQTKALALSGIDLTAATAVAYLSNNAATFMIGIRMGAAQVGLYGRANQLVQLPVQLIAPLTNVLVPPLAKARSKGEDTKKQLLRVQSLVAMWTTLILAVASSVAPTLFTVVLGPEWQPAAPVFQLLAIGGVALGLSQVSYWTFLIEGNSRELLKCDLVCKPMTTGLIVIGAFVSLEATAVAFSIALMLSWLVNTWWLRRTIGLNSRAFYSNGLRIAGAGILAALVAMEVAPFLSSSTLIQLVIPALLAALLFFLLVCTTRRGRQDLADALQVLRGVFCPGP